MTLKIGDRVEPNPQSSPWATRAYLPLHGVITAVEKPILFMRYYIEWTWPDGASTNSDSDHAALGFCYSDEIQLSPLSLCDVVEDVV